MKVVEYKNIDETVYVHEHSSGLKSFVVPKKGYSKNMRILQPITVPSIMSLSCPGKKIPSEFPTE